MTVERWVEFDRRYAEPDPWRARTAWSELSRLRRAWDWVQSLPPGRYQSVLDIGAGEGVWTRHLTSLAGRVVATDISRVAMRRARAQYGESFRCAVVDALSLSFRDGSFDLVCCMTALGYLRRPLRKSAIEELHRVLQPKGHILLVDSLAPDRFVPGELPELMRPLFRVERVAAGNVRIRGLSRLAGALPAVFGRLYDLATRTADRWPEKLALHVMYWATRLS